jgi:hypothetical protein
MRSASRGRPVWRWPVLGLVAAALGLFLLAGVQAQGGGTIGYGSRVFGSIPAPAQTVAYSLTGTAGDLVQATARTWTGTLAPQLDLVAPDGTTLTSSTAPFLDVAPAAHVSALLPQTGVYTLRIGGAGETTGDFILNLAGRAPTPATTLSLGEPVDVAVPLAPPDQLFRFDAGACPTVFTLTNLSDGLPFTFPFYAEVYDPQGTRMAALTGGNAIEDRVVVPADSGSYLVVVRSDDPATQGSIRLLVTCLEDAPPCATGGAPASAADCPPCVGDDLADCELLDVQYRVSGLTVQFVWNAVDGADWYIFSISDAFGTMLADSAILLEGVTSHMYTFQPADLVRGPFTARVVAGSESGGSQVDCIDEVPVILDDQPADTCRRLAVTVTELPGPERAVVISWSPFAGAETYQIAVIALPDGAEPFTFAVGDVPGSVNSRHIGGFLNWVDRYRVRIVGSYETTDASGNPTVAFCAGETEFAFDPQGPVDWGPAIELLDGSSDLK